MEQAPSDTYDPALKSWWLEALPILPANLKVEVEVKPKNSSQFKAVLKETTEVVIATDADREGEGEGEMIARELLEHCGYRGPVQRLWLWLFALNDASIRQALVSLKPGAETFL